MWKYNTPTTIEGYHEMLKQIKIANEWHNKNPSKMVSKKFCYGMIFIQQLPVIDGFATNSTYEKTWRVDKLEFTPRLGDACMLEREDRINDANVPDILHMQKILDSVRYDELPTEQELREKSKHTIHYESQDFYHKNRGINKNWTGD